MKGFNILGILEQTQAKASELSLNLDNQYVVMWRSNPSEQHRHRVSKRTVYRIQIDKNGNLIGSLLKTGKWVRVFYDSDGRKWREQKPNTARKNTCKSSEKWI